MTEGYQPPTCTCGHVEGDHRSVRGLLTAPPIRGVCLVDGCGCERFVEAVTAGKRA